GFQAHPGEKETDSQHHHGEARNRIPQRAGTVVIRKQNDGVVPERPDGAAHERDTWKGSDFGKLRDKKSTPPEFFAERGNARAQHADRGEKKEKGRRSDRAREIRD